MDLDRRRAAPPGSHRGLFFFACFVVLATLFLLLAGAAVKSTESGLAVPDWPLSFGQVMPPMEGGVFFEHGHRMIATGVGALTILLALWLWMVDPRPWMRRLGWIALGMVILQGVLGGMTVLLKLPTAVSAAHATLAQGFFLTTVFLALALSKGWNTSPVTGNPTGSRLPILATATTALLLVQLVLGAVTRHMNAGLVIPDVPLAYGRLVPPVWTPEIAVHYAHRVGALVLLVLITVTHISAFKAPGKRWDIRVPGILLMLLVVMQVTLGLLVVVTERHLHVTNTHLVVGATLFATSLVLTARAWRFIGRPGSDPAPAAVPEGVIA